MGVSVSKSQFKAKALEYFRQVELTGEPLVVTDRGQPCVEVRPYRPPVQSPLTVLKDSVVHYHKPTDPVGDDDWDALA